MSEATLRTEALTAARLARQLGLSQEAIAGAIGASQSQVSRVLSGNSRRRSRLFDAVCKYVSSHATERRGSASIMESPELVAAVESVWDGSPTHAQALASVIRSLAALHPGSDLGAEVRQEVL